MQKYAIKRNNRNKTVAILNYDEKKKEYTIDIPEGITEKEPPFMISLFLKKGVWHIDPNHTLLLNNEGRSCQDEFYIEHL